MKNWIAIVISVVALIISLYVGLENNKIQQKNTDLQIQAKKNNRDKRYNRNTQQLDQFIRLEKYSDKYCKQFFKKTFVKNLEKTQELDKCFSKSKNHKSFWRKAKIPYNIQDFEEDLGLQERVISAMKDTQIEAHPKLKKLFYSKVKEKNTENLISINKDKDFIESSHIGSHKGLGLSRSAMHLYGDLLKVAEPLDVMNNLTNQEISSLNNCFVQPSREKISTCFSEQAKKLQTGPQ